MNGIFGTFMRPCIKNRNWPYSHSCHLFADTTEELVEFALALGLKKSYLQGNLPNRPGFVHFDLTFGMRAAAVRAGAKQVDYKEFSRIYRERMREHRKKGGERDELGRAKL